MLSGYKKSGICLKQGSKIRDFCLKQGQGLNTRAAPPYPRSCPPPRGKYHNNILPLIQTGILKYSFRILKNYYLAVDFAIDVDWGHNPPKVLNIHLIRFY